MNKETFTTTMKTSDSEWDAVEATLATFYKNLYYRLWSDYVLEKFGLVKKFETIEEIDHDLDEDDLEFWRSKFHNLKNEYNSFLKR